MLRPTKTVFMLLLCAGVLTACGGGGSSSVPASQPQATSFALQAGYKARIAAGSTSDYVVSGTCSGTANSTDSVPVAASFEGAPALAANTSFTLAVTNCTPASNTVVGQVFYDSNYTPLGTSVPGSAYGKFLVTPSPLPASVKVGDSKEFGVQTMYSDGTKTVLTGKRVYSFVVQADTSTTALVTFIVLGYDASSQLLVTELSKYRIAVDGAMTQLSLEFQYANGTDLVFTKV